MSSKEDKVKTITVTLTASEVDAMEDAFYIVRTPEWYEKNRNHMHSIWYKIVHEFDKEV